MKRAKLEMLRRNAIIAAGNTLSTHEFDRLRDVLEHIVEDDAVDEMVRQAASLALKRQGS